MDFRRGRRLGKDDHVVEWLRPERPKWMDLQDLRHAVIDPDPRNPLHVGHPGFRVESLVVVTTLTDADQYTPDDIAELYGCRWLAELDIRAIKITMGMDILRCKTPAMVRKEMWTCLLAYNLIRRAMLQSARAQANRRADLSFSAALQAIAASWQVIVLSGDWSVVRLVAVELENLADHTVGDRPGRVEPRAVKRRPKPQDLLTKPRPSPRRATGRRVVNPWQAGGSAIRF